MVLLGKHVNDTKVNQRQPRYKTSYYQDTHDRNGKPRERKPLQKASSVDLAERKKNMYCLKLVQKRLKTRDASPLGKDIPPLRRDVSPRRINPSSSRRDVSLKRRDASPRRRGASPMIKDASPRRKDGSPQRSDASPRS